VQTTTPDRAQELVLARANAIVNQVSCEREHRRPVGMGDSLLVGPEATSSRAAWPHERRPRADDRSRRRRRNPANRHRAPTDVDQFTPADAPLSSAVPGRIDPAGGARDKETNDDEHSHPAVPAAPSRLPASSSSASLTWHR